MFDDKPNSWAHLRSHRGPVQGRGACAYPLRVCEHGDGAHGLRASPMSSGEAGRTVRDEDDVLDRYDDNRNGRITCKEAQRHGIAPVHRSHPACRYMRAGDGVVCE